MGLGSFVRNPYKSIIVRSIEVIHALDEALRIIDTYEPPATPSLPVHPRAATGYACTEAPRGTLYHRYRFDRVGEIKEATIIPPTSQNQRMMEQDLRRYSTRVIDAPDDELARECERNIRNFDPCISCATHFLRLDIERK